MLPPLPPIPLESSASRKFSQSGLLQCNNEMKKNKNENETQKQQLHQNATTIIIFFFFAVFIIAIRLCGGVRDLWRVVCIWRARAPLLCEVVPPVLPFWNRKNYANEKIEIINRWLPSLSLRHTFHSWAMGKMEPIKWLACSRGCHHARATVIGSNRLTKSSECAFSVREKWRKKKKKHHQIITVNCE